MSGRREYIRPTSHPDSWFTGAPEWVRTACIALHRYVDPGPPDRFRLDLYRLRVIHWIASGSCVDEDGAIAALLRRSPRPFSLLDQPPRRPISHWWPDLHMDLQPMVVQPPTAFIGTEGDVEPVLHDKIPAAWFDPNDSQATLMSLYNA